MKSWNVWVVGIIILCIAGGISILIIENIPETLKAIGQGLFISCVVGYIAFHVICPKKKRGIVANRITVVVALLAFSSSVLASLIFHPEFSLKLFLLEGVLVGTITMSVIYGIAEAIHWAVTGKSMAWSELQDFMHKFEKDVFWFLK